MGGISMSKRVFGAGAIAALLCASAAPADVVFNFGIEFSGGTTPAGPAPWATATFADAGADMVMLTMDLTALAVNNPDAKVDGWYFNFTPEGSVGSLTIAYQSGTEAASVGKGANSFKADGDGKYDILFSYDTADGDPNKFDAGEMSVYKITGTGITAESFNVLSQDAGGHGPFLSALHALALSPGGGSGWLAPGEMIPLPTGAAMATAGFGLLVLRRRR
jgi:hypothetical protein